MRKPGWFLLMLSAALLSGCRLSLHGRERIEFGSLIGASEAIPAPLDGRSFCSMTREDFRTTLLDSKNHLAFNNDLGPIRTGLCWWHSALQRQATYLVVYRPDLPRPHAKEIVDL